MVERGENSPATGDGKDTATGAGNRTVKNKKRQTEKKEKKKTYFRIKRTFDVIASSCTLILLSPVLLITALAIKIEDGGPVIFAQERIGKDGEPFKMYKFRSMCVDAEKMLKSVKKNNEADGPVFKIKDDPRITKVGRFIRKFSIDELPQLINILHDDMSVVGPRPALPYEVKKYDSHERQRLNAKPGLTCYWQISGRSDLNFGEWMNLDIKYVNEMSIWTDIKIIFKTIPVVLKGDGAC